MLCIQKQKLLIWISIEVFKKYLLGATLFLPIFIVLYWCVFFLFNIFLHLCFFHFSPLSHLICSFILCSLRLAAAGCRCHASAWTTKVRTQHSASDEDIGGERERRDDWPWPADLMIPDLGSRLSSSIFRSFLWMFPREFTVEVCVLQSFTTGLIQPC